MERVPLPSPQDLLDCDAKPWGYALAAASTGSGAQTPDSSATAMAHAMQSNMRALRRLHPEYYTSINNVFLLRDSQIAQADLSDTISLPGNDVLGWAIEARPAELALLATWNVSRAEQLAHAHNKRRESLAPHIEHGVTRLVNYGLIPAQARKSFDISTRLYRDIRPMDSFEAGAKRADGYCSHDTIALANIFGRPQQMTVADSHYKEVLLHEYTHGAGIKTHAGFLNMTGDAGKAHHRALEEAVVKHWASVAMSAYDNAQPHVVEPTKRQHDNGTYHTERSLLHAITNSKDGVSLEELGVAYFASHENPAKHAVLAKVARYFTARSLDLQQFSHAYEYARSAAERAEILQPAIDSK